MSYVPVAYIAAPFGAETQELVDFNVARAVFVATLARLEGRAPLLVHLNIAAGVFGDDNDPDQRAFGAECSLALLDSVRFIVTGELWVLEHDDGSLSAGVSVEDRRWRLFRKSGVRRSRWSGWRALAARHGLEDAWRALRNPPGDELGELDEGERLLV